MLKSQISLHNNERISRHLETPQIKKIYDNSTVQQTLITFGASHFRGAAEISNGHTERKLRDTHNTCM